MCRKPCKECPWTNENKHSVDFRKYSEKMESIGKIGAGRAMHTIPKLAITEKDPSSLVIRELPSLSPYLCRQSGTKFDQEQIIGGIMPAALKVFAVLTALTMGLASPAGFTLPQPQKSELTRVPPEIVPPATEASNAK